MFLFAMILCASSAWSANYYVANAGNDSCNGTSSALGSSGNCSWKTIAHVNAQTFSAGDFILLNRGDLWREQLTVPSSGSAGNVITFSNYGAGSLPIISGANVLSGWSNTAGNVWQAAATPPTGDNGGNETERVALFNGSYGYRQTSQAAVVSVNQWYWAANVLYVYSPSSPATFYTSPGIEVPQRDSGINLNGKNNITINGILATTANTSDFEVGASDNVSILNSPASMAGYYGIHSNATAAIQHLTVTNSSTDHSGGSGMSLNVPLNNPYSSVFTVAGNSSYRDGLVSYLFVETGDTNNTYYWPSAMHIFGITGSSFTYNVAAFTGIRDDGFVPNQAVGNKITGAGFWIDTARSSSLGTANNIEYNLAINTANDGVFYEKSEYGIVGYNVALNPCQAVGSGQPCAGIESNEDTGTSYHLIGNLFFNNTVSGSGANGIQLRGDYGGVAGSVVNNLLTNNIAISSTGANLSAQFGGENDGTDGSGNTYTYNSFGTQRASFIEWGVTNFYATYATWETAVGNCGSGGCSHSATTTPTLLANLSPASGSTAIDSGTNLGASYQNGLNPLSIFPNAVTLLNQNSYGSAWDIGAYIYLGSATQPTLTVSGNLSGSVK